MRNINAIVVLTNPLYGHVDDRVLAAGGTINPLKRMRMDFFVAFFFFFSRRDIPGILASLSGVD